MLWLSHLHAHFAMGKKFQDRTFGGQGSRLVLVSSLSHLLKGWSHSTRPPTSFGVVGASHLNNLAPAWLQQGICLQCPGPHPGTVDDHVCTSSCHLAAGTVKGQEGVRTILGPSPSSLFLLFAVLFLETGFLCAASPQASEAVVRP